MLATALGSNTQSLTNYKKGNKHLEKLLIFLVPFPSWACSTVKRSCLIQLPLAKEFGD